MNKPGSISGYGIFCSICTNPLEKGMNPSIPIAQTEDDNFWKAVHLEEKG